MLQATFWTSVRFHDARYLFHASNSRPDMATKTEFRMVEYFDMEGVT